jgi:hypothetical protein
VAIKIEKTISILLRKLKKKTKKISAKKERKSKILFFFKARERKIKRKAKGIKNLKRINCLKK